MVALAGQQKLFSAENQAELWYFDAYGVVETTRTLFAAAEVPFKVLRRSCPNSLALPLLPVPQSQWELATPWTQRVWVLAPELLIVPPFPSCSPSLC